VFRNVKDGLKRNALLTFFKEIIKNLIDYLKCSFRAKVSKAGNLHTVGDNLTTRHDFRITAVGEVKKRT